jgi:hypothetical protein
MHMIRHHAPFEQTVAFPIKMKEGILDKLCDAWVLQVAGSMACIFVAGYPVAQLSTARGRWILMIFQVEFCTPSFE